MVFWSRSVWHGSQAPLEAERWGSMPAVGNLRRLELLSTLWASAGSHPTADGPLPLSLPRHGHPGVKAGASGQIEKVWLGLCFLINPSRGRDTRGVQLGLYT